MKLVVIEEVERLLFRNNIAQKAQYYGICFLNLIRLDGEHASLAHKLITVYLAFFKSCVKTVGFVYLILSNQNCHNNRNLIQHCSLFVYSIGRY